VALTAPGVGGAVKGIAREGLKYGTKALIKEGAKRGGAVAAGYVAGAAGEKVTDVVADAAVESGAITQEQADTARAIASVGSKLAGYAGLLKGAQAKRKSSQAKKGPDKAVDNVKGKVHKNSRSYEGDSHVYVIRDADENVLKVGKSSQGTRIKDGASKRAEQQVRALNKKYGPGHTSEIRKKFDNSGKALDYEKKLRDRIRRRYGKDKLPLNKEHLRGKKKQ
jgi:hypothetical protein